ncbi:protein SYM1-like [Nicotiana tabacum]|uniref:PXMP2/4 family protein 4-like n=2 Tax=Nicotiana TaxID=4085 RepID=A0A1S4BS53_TOBAC|nr:PREDICTED: PXMP2/4 family protein 4-like [Nicotiana sylvestris]XP_016491717.1 PREDICTED: PXMP2/4 family protein 4-like [Nicotiana tabacum]
MGIAKLAKRSIVHQSKFRFSSNPISGSQFASHYQQCRAYSARSMNTAATKVPKPHFLSFPTFLRKSSECANTKMGFLAWYLGALESRPIITKSISSAIIYAAADVTSQVITMSPSDSLDIVRTLRMAGFGLIILGTAQHLWFNYMGRVLPKRDVVSTLKKLLIGQFAYGPLINSAFFSFNAALQGENGEEIAARLKRDLLPTMIKGLMYWPMCDFLTYKVIPVHLQPLINSSFSYAWTIYLTYVASLKKAASD